MSSFWQTLAVEESKQSTSISKVPNGWLLKETLFRDKDYEEPISCSLLFISDPNHEQEEKWSALAEDYIAGYYDEKMKTL